MTHATFFPPRLVTHLRSSVLKLPIEWMILCITYCPGLNIYATVAMLLRTDLNISQLQTVDASYLLIEQGPEHGQRDVENQNAQHHLDLLDQAFLIGVNRDKVEGDGEGEVRPEGLQLGCEFLHGRAQLPSTCPRPSPASGPAEARPLTSASVV